MVVNSLFALKLSKSQQNKAVEVASRLKIDVNWLLAVIYFETARTFSPTKTNQIGSVGLIQFTHDVGTPNQKKINGKVYSLSYIKTLSFEKQMDLVFEYYKPFIGKMSSFLDVYFVTFFPLAVSKGDSFIMETSKLSASLIASQNPIFDTNKDKKITRGEVKQFFEKWYSPKIFSQIQGFTIGMPLVLLFILLLFIKLKN
jgi:hypothetical protein